MKLGDKITIPPQSFMKEITRQDGTKLQSFLYNVSEKNKETEKYEIIERYVVFVLNIRINPNDVIVVKEITQTVPKKSVGKDGREFLNNLVWINAELQNEVKQKEESGFTVHEDTPLPF